MQRLYEDPAYAPAWPDSHWRATAPLPAPRPALSGAETAEVAVIGAGYAGLNAALELAGRFGREVAVLDSAQPGWGASGRNGGFCCLGGAKLSDAQIVARVGEDGARAFHRFQLDAIAQVADNLERFGIDARQGPGGDVCLAHSPAAFAGFAAEAEGRRRLYGSPTELVPKAALAERGLAGPAFHGAAILSEGFPIHPLRYAEGLAAAALSTGARIYGASPVTAMAAEAGGWRLTTPGGTLRARQVLVATNGYSSEDLPAWLGGRLLPAFSAILVTRPLTAAERQAQGFTTPMMAYDSRRLLHYVRHLPDGRFMFGMRGGTAATPAAIAANRARVRAEFEALFPAWAGVEAEREWSGLVCLTGSLTPYVGPVPGAEGLFAALGWHGNGVAPATLGGRLAARLMSGAEAAIPALVAAPPRRFPLPALRRPWLRLAYAAYGLQDGRLPARAAR